MKGSVTVSVLLLAAAAGVTACRQASVEEEPVPAASAEVKEEPTAPQGRQRASRVAAKGSTFFTELPQFLQSDEIRAIGAVANRLNRRYDVIIDAHRELIQDARVLDLASYDGRWMYAALDAGAKSVAGVEIDPEFIKKAEKNLSELGMAADRYDLILGDVLEEARKIPEGAFDGVICAGIFYHIPYHAELLRELKRIGVEWIIMDTRIEPVIRFETSPFYKGNAYRGLEGIPSLAAIELLLASQDFRFEQVPTKQMTGQDVEAYKRGTRVTLTVLRK